MIITRTPFRISFAGGGSDLRSFYSRHPGCVLSTSINKHMYILVHPYFEQKYLIKYSRTELVDSIDEIQHPIIRAALRQFDIRGIDINSVADVPAGTGLGSSCSFTVGLLHALYAYAGQFASKEMLARKACEVEIDILRDPIGKQDQYAAAFGGLNLITFHPDESVDVSPIVMPAGARSRLAQNLVAFYLGSPRSASSILAEQQANVAKQREKFDCLVRMTELARQLQQSLACGNIDEMGPILHENWRLKKQLCSHISEGWIDAQYDAAICAGATGGKLLGAGGGGFLLVYCPLEFQPRLLHDLAGLRRFPFSFESAGTTIIHYEGDA